MTARTLNDGDVIDLLRAIARQAMPIPFTLTMNVAPCRAVALGAIAAIASAAADGEWPAILAGSDRTG